MDTQVIGIKGERTPQICAVSGRPLIGQPGTNITLRHPYYVRVLPPFKGLWTPEHKIKLIKTLPSGSQSSKAKED